MIKESQPRILNPESLWALVIPMGLMFLLWGASLGQAQLMQTTLDESQQSG